MLTLLRGPFLWALLLAPDVPAFAADPVPPAPNVVVPVAAIRAPASVPAGCPIVLYAGDNAVSAAPVSWKLIAPKVAFGVYDQAGRPGVLCVVPGEVTAATTGLYKFVQIATGSSATFDFDFAEVVVAAAGPPPGPGPRPPPGPGPIPPPIPPVPPAPTGVTAKLCVSYLYDPANKKPSDLLIQADSDLAAAIAALNARLLTRGLGEKGVETLTPVVQAQGGPPALVIQADEDTPDGFKRGHVYEVSPAAGWTSAQVLARVKAIRGSQ